MDLDKIITENEYLGNLDQTEAIAVKGCMKEAIRQALELASLKSKVKWDDHENEFDVIHDDDRKIVVSKKSIMSVMDEL